jgi:hypothetical protein
VAWQGAVIRGASSTGSRLELENARRLEHLQFFKLAPKTLILDMMNKTSRPTVY